MVEYRHGMLTGDPAFDSGERVNTERWRARTGCV